MIRRARTAAGEAVSGWPQNCARRNSMLRCYCRTLSMPRGWPGARAFPSASVTPATAAGCCSPNLSRFPRPAKFPYTKNSTISNFCAGPVGLNIFATRSASLKLLEAGSRPNAVRLAIGAGASYGSAKCWPPDRFASAINLLLQNTDADVILFGTPGESQVADAIVRDLKRAPINLTGKTAIAELPALLSQCHLFLGNDSGAMHVAAAVGLPVVAIFGPTDPEGTAPVTPRVTIVQQKPYCSPCFLRRCPTDHRCMTAVTPVMVESALTSALAEVPSA